jgi:hypothetical protein
MEARLTLARWTGLFFFYFAIHDAAKLFEKHNQ